jgi:hypothetical protein
MARGTLPVVILLSLCSPAVAGEAKLRGALPTYDSAALTALATEDQAVTSESPAEWTDLWAPMPTADLWLHGIPDTPSAPELFLDVRPAPYPSAGVVPSVSVTDPTRRSFNFGFSTNVTTPPTPTVTYFDFDPREVQRKGGTGEFKGRAEFDAERWQLYGAGEFGMATADPTVSVTDKVAVGTFYKLPSIEGGKIGGGIEVNNLTESKARFEYRHVIGSGEGFVAAERGLVPRYLQQEAPPPTAIRGGYKRQF